MEVECLGEKDLAINVTKNGEEVKAMLAQSLFWNFQSPAKDNKKKNPNLS